MIKDLIKMANHFDKIGLSKQADIIDILIKKLPQKIMRKRSLNVFVKII